jgi:ATP-dependent Clp protease ATP-binding subunit ClpX
VSVDPLDKEALIRILVEPKNALVKQYRYMLSLDNVDLEFENSALEAAAEMALGRGTGARGLRSIIEKTLLDVMFSVPGTNVIRRVVVDEAAIRGERGARLYDADGNELCWNGSTLDPVKPAA